MESIYSRFGHFLCACAETQLFLLPVRNLLSPSFSATSISCKTTEILAIWRFSLFLAICLLRMRRNGNFRTSGYYSDNTSEFSGPDVPQQWDISAIGRRFQCFFFAFCIEKSVIISISGLRDLIS